MTFELLCVVDIQVDKEGHQAYDQEVDEQDKAEENNRRRFYSSRPWNRLESEEGVRAANLKDEGKYLDTTPSSASLLDQAEYIIKLPSTNTPAKETCPAVKLPEMIETTCPAGYHLPAVAQKKYSRNCISVNLPCVITSARKG